MRRVTHERFVSQSPHPAPAQPNPIHHNFTPALSAFLYNTFLLTLRLRSPSQTSYHDKEVLGIAEERFHGRRGRKGRGGSCYGTDVLRKCVSLRTQPYRQVKHACTTACLQ